MMEKYKVEVESGIKNEEEFWVSFLEEQYKQNSHLLIGGKENIPSLQEPNTHNNIPSTSELSSIFEDPQSKRNICSMYGNNKSRDEDMDIEEEMKQQIARINSHSASIIGEYAEHDLYIYKTPNKKLALFQNKESLSSSRSKVKWEYDMDNMYNMSDVVKHSNNRVFMEPKGRSTNNTQEQIRNHHSMARTISLLDPISDTFTYILHPPAAENMFNNIETLNKAECRGDAQKNKGIIYIYIYSLIIFRFKLLCLEGSYGSKSHIPCQRTLYY